MVLKGERISVPSCMQKEMEDLLHTGRVEIERCKHHARESIYWPGLNGELKDLVLNCSTFLKYRNVQLRSQSYHTTCQLKSGQKL